MAGAAETGRGDWEDLVRRMFPPGTTIPEAPPNLDYSIALEYDGPDVSYELPRIDPVCLPSIPTAEPASGPLGLGLGVVPVAPVVIGGPAVARVANPPPAPGASRAAAAHRAAAAPAKPPVHVRSGSRSSSSAGSAAAAAARNDDDEEDGGYSDDDDDEEDGSRRPPRSSRPEGRRPQVRFGEPEDSRYESKEEFDEVSADQYVVLIS